MHVHMQSSWLFSGFPVCAFMTSLCEDHCPCWLGYEMKAHNVVCDHAARKPCRQHQDILCVPQMNVVLQRLAHAVGLGMAKRACFAKMRTWV